MGVASPYWAKLLAVQSRGEIRASLPIGREVVF